MSAASGSPWRLRRRRAVTLAAAGALAAAGVAIGLDALRPDPAPRFAAPEGWLDLSPGAPAERFRGIPEALVSQARSGRFEAVAAEPAEAGEPVTQTFNARLRPGSLRVDAKAVLAVASALQGALRSAGPEVRSTDAGIVEIGGVPSIRVEARLEAAGLVARNVVYSVPMGRRTAVLTYSCAEHAWARCASAVERSARATAGARAPTLPERMDLGRTAAGGAAALLCGAAALALAAALRHPA